MQTERNIITITSSNGDFKFYIDNGLPVPGNGLYCGQVITRIDVAELRRCYPWVEEVDWTHEDILNIGYWAMVPYGSTETYTPPAWGYIREWAEETIGGDLSQANIDRVMGLRDYMLRKGVWYEHRVLRSMTKADRLSVLKDMLTGLKDIGPMDDAEASLYVEALDAAITCLKNTA